MTPEELTKLRGLVAHSKATSERTGARGALFDWKHVEPVLDHVTALEAENAALEIECGKLLEKLAGVKAILDQHHVDVSMRMQNLLLWRAKQ